MGSSHNWTCKLYGTDIESQSGTLTKITATNIKWLLPLSTHSNNLKQRYRTNLNKRDKILLLINRNKKNIIDEAIFVLTL